MIKILNPRIEFFSDYNGFSIMARDAQGYEYVLSDGDGFVRTMSYTKADMVLDAIKKAGNMINPDHWGVRAPYGTEAWLLDGMEDRQIEDERFGYF